MDQPKIPVRVVVCAANLYRFETGSSLLICGPRHYDMTMHDTIAALDDEIWTLPKKCTQGFVDQWGMFMDRKEALLVATAAGQINVRRPKSGNPDSPELFSEDLY